MYLIPSVVNTLALVLWTQWFFKALPYILDEFFNSFTFENISDIGNQMMLAGVADYEAANPLFAQANALLNDPEVNIYFSPQNLSYGTVRGLLSEALAEVTTNGRDVQEVAEELEAEANEVLADSQ